jgi:hypothetical protein
MEPHRNARIDEQLDEFCVQEIAMNRLANEVVMPSSRGQPTSTLSVAQGATAVSQGGRAKRPSRTHRVVVVAAVQRQHAEAEIGEVEQAELLFWRERESTSALIESIVGRRKAAETLAIPVLICDFEEAHLAPGPSQPRLWHEQFRDECRLSSWVARNRDGLRTRHHIVVAHVVVARQDYDPRAVTVEKSVRQSDEEFLRLSILPIQLLGRIRCVRFDPVNKVAANNADRGHHYLGGLRAVLPEISIKGVEKTWVVYLVAQVTVKVRNVEN